MYNKKLNEMLEKINKIPKHYFSRSLLIDKNELLVLCNNIIENNVKNIIEIGTFKGAAAAIFSSIIEGDVYTINVNDEEIKYAKSMWNELGITNIKQIKGSSLDVLPTLVNDLNDVNFIYVDGMHSIPYPRMEFDIIRKSKIKNQNCLIYFDDGPLDGVMDAINTFNLKTLKDFDWMKADEKNKNGSGTLRAYEIFGNFKTNWELK
jgi:predicted O-methyltransferase YrrM